MEMCYICSVQKSGYEPHVLIEMWPEWQRNYIFGLI